MASSEEVEQPAEGNEPVENPDLSGVMEVQIDHSIGIEKIKKLLVSCKEMGISRACVGPSKALLQIGLKEVVGIDITTKNQEKHRYEIKKIKLSSLDVQTGKMENVLCNAWCKIEKPEDVKTSVNAYSKKTGSIEATVATETWVSEQQSFRIASIAANFNPETKNVPSSIFQRSEDNPIDLDAAEDLMLPSSSVVSPEKRQQPNWKSPSIVEGSPDEKTGKTRSLPDSGTRYSSISPKSAFSEGFVPKSPTFGPDQEEYSRSITEKEIEENMFMSYNKMTVEEISGPIGTCRIDERIFGRSPETTMIQVSQTAAERPMEVHENEETDSDNRTRSQSSKVIDPNEKKKSNMTDNEQSIPMMQTPQRSKPLMKYQALSILDNVLKTPPPIVAPMLPPPEVMQDIAAVVQKGMADGTARRLNEYDYPEPPFDDSKKEKTPDRMPHLTPHDKPRKVTPQRPSQVNRSIFQDGRSPVPGIPNDPVTEEELEALRARHSTDKSTESGAIPISKTSTEYPSPLSLPAPRASNDFTTPVARPQGSQSATSSEKAQTTRGADTANPPGTSAPRKQPPVPPQIYPYVRVDPKHLPPGQKVPSTPPRRNETSSVDIGTDSPVEDSAAIRERMHRKRRTIGNEALGGDSGPLDRSRIPPHRLTPQQLQQLHLKITARKMQALHGAPHGFQMMVFPNGKPVSQEELLALQHQHMMRVAQHGDPRMMQYPMKMLQRPPDPKHPQGHPPGHHQHFRRSAHFPGYPPTMIGPNGLPVHPQFAGPMPPQFSGQVHITPEYEEYINRYHFQRYLRKKKEYEQMVREHQIAKGIVPPAEEIGSPESAHRENQHQIGKTDDQNASASKSVEQPDESSAKLAVRSTVRHPYLVVKSPVPLRGSAPSNLRTSDASQRHDEPSEPPNRSEPERVADSEKSSEATNEKDKQKTVIECITLSDDDEVTPGEVGHDTSPGEPVDHSNSGEPAAKRARIETEDHGSGEREWTLEDEVRGREEFRKQQHRHSLGNVRPNMTEQRVMSRRSDQATVAPVVHPGNANRQFYPRGHHYEQSTYFKTANVGYGVGKKSPKKRSRFSWNPIEKKTLKRHWVRGTYKTPEQIKKIAEELNRDEGRVRVFYDNQVKRRRIAENKAVDMSGIRPNPGGEEDEDEDMDDFEM
ncbi:hypothetical protein L3Y34_018339 [Caenorhabditis briggsae]|uniref:Homeobox domain-containing protein n=1 Tax=Caenorhabditis briggsae TaxID=6238 RepID=A0AAE9DKM1_CAEBR|nr:hypothetical protein L3Y34_018339 [Caenorhabditis briggsae]